MEEVKRYEGNIARAGISNVVKGLENVDEEDIIQPRIKLNQSNSPAVVDGKAKPGEFMNSLSGVVYGNKILFQPVIYGKTRIKWLSGDDLGGWDCRSFDGKQGDVYGFCSECEFSKWAVDSDGNRIPPLCNVIHNFLSIIREPAEYEGDLVIVSFIRTSARQGQQLINRIRYAGNCAWARNYLLTSQHVKDGQYSYFVMKVDSGVPASKEQQEQANVIYDRWAGKQIVADIRDESDEFSADNEDENSKITEADKGGSDRSTNEEVDVDELFD